MLEDIDRLPVRDVTKKRLAAAARDIERVLFLKGIEHLLLQSFAEVVFVHQKRSSSGWRSWP